MTQVYGSTVGLSLQAGYEGTISRSIDDITNTIPLNSAANAVNFGAPLFLNTDYTVFDAATSSLTNTPTFANFIGFAVNIVQSGYQGNQYQPGALTTVLRRGTISKKCAFSTGIVAGGAVFMRTSLNTGSFPAENVGDLRAAADSGHTIQLTNCRWKTGVLDANGIGELLVLTANN